VAGGRAAVDVRAGGGHDRDDAQELVAHLAGAVAVAVESVERQAKQVGGDRPEEALQRGQSLRGGEGPT
jgi:hypothetical protein